MITCSLRYVIDPFKEAEFEDCILCHERSLRPMFP